MRLFDCGKALALASCLAACLASAGARAAEPAEDFTPRGRATTRAIVLGEWETANYIIAKILEKFKYHGYDKLGEWTMHNPALVYQRPFLDFTVVKQLRIPGEPDENDTLVFRINLGQVKAAQIEGGVLHVICVSRCVEAASNGATAGYDYFWINAITIHNPIDATRVNRAFRHLLSFYPVRREPFDGAPQTAGRR